MKIEESKVSKKILTNGDYFYYHGKSYQYNTEGANVIENLTQNIPEAKFEIESYHAKAGNAVICRVLSIGCAAAGTFFDYEKRNNTPYEKEEVTNNNYGLYFWGVAGLFAIMEFGEEGNAKECLKRAIMYYNKGLTGK
jgi:hypothetical protein